MEQQRSRRRPGAYMTATDLSAGNGHSAQDGTDAILAIALGPDSPTGTFRDRDGDLPW